jgi:hypothetical protein
MATFYQGTRPVLKGRTTADETNTFTGEAGVYSNWSIMNPSHVLDGAPDTAHTPGTGYHPHGLQMTRMFRGLDTQSQVWEMATPGAGVRLEGFRYHPLENKAAGNNLAFRSGFGHADRVTDYSLLDQFDDTDRQRRLDDPGHAIRYVDAAGTANSFGYFNHYIYKGITTPPLQDTSQAVPDGYDNEYGHNRVMEWQGVTSAQALSV